MKLTLLRDDKETLDYLNREFIDYTEFLEVVIKENISSDTGVLPSLEDGDMVISGSSVANHLNSLKSDRLLEYASVKPEFEEVDLHAEKLRYLTQAASLVLGKAFEIKPDAVPKMTNLFEVIDSMQEVPEFKEICESFFEYKKSTNRKRSKETIKVYALPDLN